MLPGDAKIILVVEDDHDIREMMQSILADEGYRVWCASNGKAALELIARENLLPDLILLDLMMPVMGGEAFLAEMPRAGLLDVPVLLLTASHSGAKLNTMGNLKKPLDLDQLLAEVARLAVRRN